MDSPAGGVRPAAAAAAARLRPAPGSRPPALPECSFLPSFF